MEFELFVVILFCLKAPDGQTVFIIMCQTSILSSESL